MLSINNPAESTYIFIGIFLTILLISYKRSYQIGLTHIKTQELKGFAICSVLFAHIGYFLSNQHDFLFPLSVLAGVGVNIFLFLSGYGLTISSLTKKESVIQFYKRKIFSLMIPFWIVLIIYLILDFLILNITYTKEFIVQSFWGIFPHADIFRDLNSPLWYMTLILFYYILFPLVFFRKKLWLSALFIYIASWLVFKVEPEKFISVLELYEVHAIAFPLGIFVAWLFQKEYINIFFKKFLKLVAPSYIRYIFYFILIAIISYFAIHSGVGEDISFEQKISLLTMISIIIFTIMRRGEFKLFTLLGIYSYEIYLLHWPLMYRYDLLYQYLPAWFATLLYIPLLIALGLLLKIISKRIIIFFKK